MFLGLAAANRDPEFFPRPDDLDLDRDARAHLAFGLGHHFCLGARLARVEATIVFDALADRFETIDVQASQVRWKPGILMRSPVSLPLRLQQRRRMT